MVNSPHNPSGAHFTREEWAALCALCERHGAYLFRWGWRRAMRVALSDGCRPAQPCSLAGVGAANVGGPEAYAASSLRRLSATKRGRRR